MCCFPVHNNKHHTISKSDQPVLNCVQISARFTENGAIKYNPQGIVRAWEPCSSSRSVGIDKTFKFTT